MEVWKGERLTITADSLTKSVHHIDEKNLSSTDSARCGNPDKKIPPAPGTNLIEGYVEFRPFASWEKVKQLYYTPKHLIRWMYLQI